MAFVAPSVVSVFQILSHNFRLVDDSRLKKTGLHNRNTEIFKTLVIFISSTSDLHTKTDMQFFFQFFSTNFLPLIS